MKLPYEKDVASPTEAFPKRKAIFRPKISIRLIKGTRFVNCLALVDSGADECIFPAELGELIGIHIIKGKIQHFRGIGRGIITAYFHNVTLQAGEHKFTSYVGFSDAPGVVPILGQSGFFNLFRVCFDLSKRELELTPVSK